MTISFCGARHAVADMHAGGACPFAVAIGTTVGTHPEVVVAKFCHCLDELFVLSRGRGEIVGIGSGRSGINHLIVVHIAHPSEGGFVAIGSHTEIGRLFTGGGRSNRDVVDIDTVVDRGRACRYGQHNGHIALGSVGGDIEGVLLIAGGHGSGVAGVGDLHKGSGIRRVGHQTHLESATDVIDTSLQRDTHAGKTGHFWQDSILVGDSSSAA